MNSFEQFERQFEYMKEQLETIEEELDKKELNKDKVSSALLNASFCLEDDIYKLFENTISEEEYKALEDENKLLKEIVYNLAKNDLQLLYDLKYKYNIEDE